MRAQILCSTIQLLCILSVAALLSRRMGSGVQESSRCDVLRARKRSSERMAMAFIRRTETGREKNQRYVTCKDRGRATCPSASRESRSDRSRIENHKRA
jgi:hypothetical protein